MPLPRRYEAVVIGTSAGGLQALKCLLPALPASFFLPIAIVQHVNEHSDSFLAEFLNNLSALNVKEAEGREKLIPGTAYLAPPGYHLLIEPDKSFSLSVDPRVNHACPSIDVLFESAAEAFSEALIGVVLTGANADGAQGLTKIRRRGGLAIVQNPQTAEVSYMPQAALDRAGADHIAELTQIAPLLAALSSNGEKTHDMGASG